MPGMEKLIGDTVEEGCAPVEEAHQGSMGAVSCMVLPPEPNL